MHPIVDDKFVTMYAPLVSDTICETMGVDPSNQRARAILAWNLANPNETYPIPNPKEVSIVNTETTAFLTFSNNGERFKLALGGNYDGILEISMDKENWDRWNGELLISSSELYLRGVGNTVITGLGAKDGFEFTGSACTGNIETLLDYREVERGEHPEMNDSCYAKLFEGCNTLVVAPELPATKLAERCYTRMFEYCTSLTQAPELPATELTYECYKGMFEYCTSLVEAPKLPATELAESCYAGMFIGCTSLIEAPWLPAVKMAVDCYQSMFFGCTSLVKAQEPWATERALNCFEMMYKGCTSLEGISECYM